MKEPVGTRPFRLHQGCTAFVGPRGLKPRGSLGAIFAYFCMALAMLIVFMGPSGAWAADKPKARALLVAQDPRIEDILSKLEDRSDRLKDIRCSIELREDDRINMTQRTKTGRILLMFDQPNPTFLIQFDRTESDGVVGRREWYLFDGRWLHEGNERLRQVTRREIAAPGEKVNLFDLENAPFPMPFGQKKETILRHFEVRLVPPAPGDPSDSEHLACTPKPDSRFYRKYDQLDFFVERGLWMPRRITTSGNKGLEVMTAEFPDLSERSLNSGMKKKDFEEPEEWKKYKIVVEGKVSVEHVPRDGK